MKKFICVSISILVVVLLFFACSSKKEEPQHLLPEAKPKAIGKETKQPDLQENIYAEETAETEGSLKIVSHGPVGEAKGQVQIRIAFDTPLIPISTLSDSVRKKILGHFLLEPSIDGKFRFMGTSTVVFKPEHSLPMATAYQVTLTKGIKDIHGNELEEDFSWSFKTPLPRINVYPRNDAHHVDIEKPVRISSTIALNIESLKSKIEFFVSATDKSVQYKFYESDHNPSKKQDIGMRRVRYVYFLDPKPYLKKDTQYTVQVNSGVMTRRGNRPTVRQVSSTFKTYPPFRFVNAGFCDYCGNNLVTVPNIAFTNQPKFDESKKFISIAPTTEKWPFLKYGCEAYSIKLNDGLLEPNTTYTITLRHGLLDIYGQELENPQSVTLTTGNYTPKMWGPSGYEIITPDVEPIMGIKTVNIDNISYKLTSLKPEDVLVKEQLNYHYVIRKLISNFKTDQKRAKIDLNEEGMGKTYFDLKPFLRNKNYGAVAYSFQSPIVQCYKEPIKYNGLLLRTNLGIYAQFHPSGGVIKLNRLTDGAPIPGAKISIYRQDNLLKLEKIWDLVTNTIKKRPTPCLEAETDTNGMLLLSAKNMAGCTKQQNSNKTLNKLYPPETDPEKILLDRKRFGFAQPPELLIVAQKEDDWTFIQTDQRGNPSIWRFGVMTAWESGQPVSHGTMFSDHYIYRPGDTVKMKGISRYLLYGKLMTGEGMEYTIKLRDPHGAEKKIGKVTANEFGTFHIDIPTKAGQRLGNYQVIAKSPVRRVIFYGRFRLAEFRVPDFNVKMNVDKKIVLPDEPIHISWEGEYYFGAPMAEAQSSLNITRRRAHFQPPGWDTFSFGIPRYLEEEKVSISGRYLKETIAMDNKGIGQKTIELDDDDVPYPMTYLCDVEVEDVSRQTVSANKRITALPDHRLIGIKLSNWIVAKKDSADISVIVSNREGKALAGIPITVKLIRKEYHAVKTKTLDDRFKIEHNLVKELVHTQEIESKAEPVLLSFVPQKAGSYIIQAELKKKSDSGTAAATSLLVSGEDYVPWEKTGEDKLEITMDKQEYQIGDEAVVFIKSPFPEAELFLTVCREKMFLRDTKRIKGSAITYRFRVTKEMLPNAYVGAVLLRLGDPMVSVKEDVGKHIEKIGFAPFKVDLSSRKLDVEVMPERKKARPAQEIDVDIHVTRSDQKGHHSELTVMVVDEAVLSLTGYTPPNLLKIVYKQRGLSARVNDNRPFVIAREELLQKGAGYGGGLMAGLTGPRVRKEFLKLAYYDPELTTNENGKASFTMKLPDNLTTWRIMVVAVGKDNHFGYGDDKLVVSQPFILRAVLPRFGRIGDQFLSGVAVTNLTDGAGKVDVKAKIAGQSVALEDQEEIDDVQIDAGQSKAVLFPFKADSPGESDLTFTAHFDGIYEGREISEADALQIPLDIHDLRATETVVAVGETKDEIMQKIKVYNTVREDMGGLNILLSSTALTNIGEGAKYLVNYPYGCLEQTLSRLLALIQLKFLSDKYGFDLEAVKDVDKVIEANLKKVLQMQNSDGGFKFWPSGNRSDCYLSPYVAYLFKRSQELGYDISDDVVKRLIEFLDKTLRNPCYSLNSWQSLAEYRINILMGLHHLGRKDETYFEEYFNRRNDLSFGTQISLAYLMFQSFDWKQEARQMLTEIKNGMFVTDQTAHFESPRELPPSWSFMYSPIISTAEAIKLFLEMEPESPYVAKFARYILNARKDGRWKNTYENAKAIDGLVEISLKRESEPPDYTARVMIAGNTVLKHLFEGHQYKPEQTFVPIAELPKGVNDVVVSKDGDGYLYYILSYMYRLKGPQSARQEGFSIKRTIRQNETEKVIVIYEDEPPNQIEIEAGDVLEVVLEFSVPQTSYHLVIDDPIPAGMEAIDESLKTTSARYETSGQGRQNRRRDRPNIYRRNPINHRELRDERVAFFADVARPGIYKYRYLLRATISGVFLWPGARVSLMYEPEQFGTCAEGFVKVEE